MLEFFDVVGLGAGEFLFPVGEVDRRAFLGERDRGFHRGVSAADDKDAFAGVFRCVDESVGNFF